MINYKKYIFILSLVIFGVIGINKSQAAVEFQQPISATTTNPNIGLVDIQTLGQLPAGHTIDSIQIKYKVNSVTGGNPGQREFFSACRVPWTNLTGGGTCTSNEEDLGGVNHTFTTIGDKLVTTNFTATTTDGLKYWAILTRTFASFSGNNVTIYGSENPNTYTSGSFANDIYNIKDIYFLAGSNLLNQNTLAITYPTNNQVLTGFNSWFIDYNLTATTTGDIIINVKYGTSTSALIYNDANYLYNSFNSPPFAGAGTIQNIKNGATLFAGDYYAQAEAEIRTTTGLSYVFATSSIILFTLTQTSNPLFDFTATTTYPTGFSTSTSQDILNFCENTGVNIWQASACNLFTFLFQPHTQILDQLQGVLVSAQNIFPFNIFFQLQNDLNVSINNGVADQTFTFPITFPTGTTYANLLTPTMLVDTIGSTSKNKLFEIEGYLMWLGLIYIMCRKVLT